MHPADLWDFDDPAGSERRFRQAASAADARERGVYLTQAARALGLQERYDDGHALLDDVSAAAPTDPEVAVRLLLERGRLLRSAGDAATARPLFEDAASAAERAGLEDLEVDALHMVALVTPAEDQLAAHQRALSVARAASDPRARRWTASLLNNIGMTQADAGDWEAALASFEAALAERRQDGSPADVRVARWMVAWTLRNLGDLQAALEIQRALKAELEVAGEEDPYVDEELALLGAE